MSTNSEVRQSDKRLQFDVLMSQRLVARIDLQGSLVLETLDGDTLDLESALSDLTQQKRLQREIAIVWVPTEKVVMTEVHVPGKRKTLWMAALPYALEETLSEPVDEYHISVFNRDAKQNVSAAAVSTEDMDNWLAVLQEHGIEHAHLIPDCFRLPCQGLPTDEAATAVADGVTWSIFHTNRELKPEQPQTLVRMSAYQGFAADGEWYSVIKQQMAQTGLNIKEQVVSQQALFSSALTHLPTVQKLTLCQGEYKAKTNNKNSLYEWRWVGVLVVVIFSLWLVERSIHTQQLNEQAQYTQEQTQKLFKSLFPDTKRIVNIKAQTLTKLKEAGASPASGVELLPILQTIEPWFVNNKAVKVMEMKWEQGKASALTLEVQAPKSADIERVIKQSKSAGNKLKLRLELKNVTSDLAEGVIYVDAN